MVSVADLPAIAGVPGVVGLSAIAFEHAVAGVPVVTAWLHTFADVLAIARVRADPVISILAGVFLDCTMRQISLSD
jgi:hypothetical protein